MIELKNVSFQYPGENSPALCDISVAFPEGKCTVVTGPNGSGKSTLFRILLGLDFPTKGQYLLDGEEITRKKLSQKAFASAFHAKIGFVFQNSEVQLFTSSVEEEIAFGLRELGLPENEVRGKTDRFLRQFGLESIRSRAPWGISGGEKKRTALAAVFAMDPQILVIDEPVSGLDEEAQAWVTSFLQDRRREGRTLIIGTHSASLAHALADGEIHLDKEHRVERQTVISAGK